MKKFILSTLFALGCILSVNQASAQTFEKGANMLNIGVGLGRATKHQTIPPLSASYERSIVDGLMDYGALGLGLQFEYQGFNHPDNRGNLGLFVGPRFSFHYEFVDRLDTYLTLRGGLELFPKETGTKTSFAVGLDLGARYLFSEKFGVFTEVGTGISIVRLGMTFNM